jgi:hypothetical protein
VTFAFFEWQNDQISSSWQRRVESSRTGVGQQAQDGDFIHHEHPARWGDAVSLNQGCQDRGTAFGG